MSGWVDRTSTKPKKNASIEYKVKNNSVNEPYQIQVIESIDPSETPNYRQAMNFDIESPTKINESQLSISAKAFNFYNNEQDALEEEAMITEAIIKHQKQVNEVYKRTKWHLETEGSFYSVLIKMLIIEISSEYFQTEELDLATTELIETIQLICSHLSLSLFDYFESKKLISQLEEGYGGSKPEDIFLPLIIGYIFELDIIPYPGTHNYETKRSKMTSIGKIIKAAFEVMHGESKENFLDGLDCMLERQINILPPLL